MTTAKWMHAVLLMGVAASAAGATEAVCGSEAGVLVLFYVPFALFLMCLPPLYMLSRRGLSIMNKLAWCLALIAIDIGSCTLLVVAFFGGHIPNAIMGPIPWIFILVPGYALLCLFQIRLDARVDDKIHRR